MRRLEDFTTAEMTEAIDAHYGEAFRLLLRGVPGTSWHEEPGLVRYVSGLAHPFGNAVWGGNFAPEAASERVSELLAPIVERDVPAFWIVGASARPVDLAERLAAAGLSLASEATGMARDLSAYAAPESPEGVTVREVQSDDDLAVWTDVLSRGYGIPPDVCALMSYYPVLHGYSSSIRYFLGFLDGVAVACSSLVLSGDIAGVYCVATVEEARRRGAGAAVTTAPARVASELGFSLAILQSSAAGYPVYQKLGFQDYGKFGFYLRVPNAASRRAG